MQQYGHTPIEPGHYPPPSVLKRPIRQNANIVCLGLLLMFFLSMQALPYIWAILLDIFLLRRFLTPVVTQVIGLFNYMVAFSAPILLIGQLLHIPAEKALPMRRMRTGIVIPAVMLCLGASVVGVFLSNFIASILYAVFGVVPVMPDFPAPTEPIATLVYILSITVIPAVFEEALFRGVIMQSLRRFGDLFALWISAVLFAFSHGNLVQGPNALLMGLVIGYFVLRTGSLLTGMIIHFVNNSLAVVIELLTQTMPSHQAATVNLIVFAVYALVGAVGLIWLLVGHSGMFRIMPSSYPLSNGKKFRTFFSSVLFILFFVSTCVVTSDYFR